MTAPTRSTRWPHLAAPTFRFAALALAAAGLAGCQGIAGTQSSSQVRVIDVSPDAPALDIVQNSPAIGAPAAIYNLGFGTVSSYVQFMPGSYTHTAYIAGTQQQLAQARATLAPGSQYTLLAGNIAASLQMTVLRDQSWPAPAGQIALRFLGQSTHAAAVDLYLVSPGASLAGLAPIAANVGFGTNTGYRNVPAGDYSIVALPAGASLAATPIFTGIQASYASGSARTILLIDSASAARTADPAPALQIITAHDYDPTAS